MRKLNPSRDPAQPLNSHSENLDGVVLDALAYSQAGLRVIPVAKGEKTPLPQEWTKIRADTDQIVSWFELWPDADLGIVCGSGFTVLDVDDRAALIELAKEIPNLWDMPHVKTTRGYHFLFRSPHGVGKHHVRLNGKKIEVIGRGGYILAPPSRGREFTGWHPKDGLDKLPELPRTFYGEITLPPLAAEIDAALQRYGSEEWKADQPFPGRYPTRSEGVMGAVLCMVNEGYQDAEILDWQRKTRRYADIAAERGPGQAEREARRTLDAARRRKLERPAGKGGNLHWINELQSAVRAFPWTGRDGARSRRVMEALIAVNRIAHGKAVFSASVRALAEEAGYTSTPPVVKGLKDLDLNGWIRRTTGGPRQANQYILLIPSKAKGNLNLRNAHRSTHTSLPIELGGVCDPLCAFLTPGNDVFRRPREGGGLTSTDHQVWIYLKNPVNGRRKADIAAATGRHRNTVAVSLGRLEAFDLAEQDGLEWRPLHRDMDALAQEIGTAGRKAQEAARHREESDRHHFTSELNERGFQWRDTLRLRVPDHINRAAATICNPATGEIISCASLSESARRGLQSFLRCMGEFEGYLIPCKDRATKLTYREEKPAADVPDTPEELFQYFRANGGSVEREDGVPAIVYPEDLEEFAQANKPVLIQQFEMEMVKLVTAPVAGSSRHREWWREES